MNKKVLKTLEYDKMIDLLAEQAGSQAGKDLCRSLRPSTDLELIRSMQGETSDALSRVFRKGSLSFSGSHDPGFFLKRLEIGGSLNMSELLRICSLLEVTKRAKNYSRGERDEEIQDSLSELFLCLEPLTLLDEEIRRCILSEEEIADDASSTLKHIRRSVRNIHDKIRSQMNTMVNSSDTRTYLQDSVITMRNGRYCLPVKTESKNQVPGMIHDQSSSGSTLFIEPMAVVKLNNGLKELFLKEQEEIEAILSNLSNLVAEEASALGENFKALTALDFIFARALLAKVHNGTAPVFNTEGRIRIRKGRHPLLDEKTVVPIDIHLGDDFNLLIVTGPNTGGKTVSLKTVGLFTLMGQAGLHIPAGDRSELAVFDEVYADIGDEQSIEQSLSTFSSHMTNIVSILKHAKYKSNSLVLLDELCAGTDPTEGAALAIAILNNLHEQGIRVMATTHYSELKLYALSTEGVENASCEFSVETLSPTFRLLIGVPGKSNAFAISGKLGLPTSVIEDAKDRMDVKDESFEDLISDLESKRITMEREELEARQYKEEIESLKKQLEQKQERLDGQKEKILRRANEEANAILRDAKETADAAIKNFQKQGFANIKEAEQERKKIRSKISDTEKAMGLKSKVAPVNYKVPKKLRLGDSVKVLSMNLKGTVSSLPNEKDDLYVQMGILRSLVNRKDLVLLEDDSITVEGGKVTGAGNIKMSKSLSVPTEINLIGKTVDEALARLDKYLDDAYLARLPSVRIVHGKGTGALRNAVQHHLKGLKHVKSFRLGEHGEGDAGVTIVNFK